MWPDPKQADMHSTWEQPFPLKSYKLAFTYFYKWKNNICVCIEGKKQHTQPDKPSAPPSQAHCQGFTCTPRLGLNTGPFSGHRDPERLYTSEWPSPCTQPVPTYCLKHAKKVSTTSSCVRIMHQLVQAFPTPHTPTVHWTDVSKPAGTSLEDSTSTMGLYCTKYKLLSTFCATGAHLGGAQTQKKLCLIINALAV
jgi:hypothetical protein